MRGVAFLALLLAACGDGVPEEEQAVQDERDIAMVEEANNTPPPLQPVSPEPIGFADIERHDLQGMACNYTPGTSFGTRVIAREMDAFMKIDGEMVRFAADPGARLLPMRTRALYNGLTYSLRLDLAAETDATAGEATGAADYEGTVTLRDRYDRIVYEGAGLARCGA